METYDFPLPFWVQDTTWRCKWSFLGTAEVKVYRVYLAESAFPLSAAERYWISPEVEVGSSLVSVESWESGTGHSKQRPHCSGHRRWCWLDVGCREPKTGWFFCQKAENLQKEAGKVAGLRQAKWQWVAMSCWVVNGRCFQTVPSLRSPSGTGPADWIRKKCGGSENNFCQAEQASWIQSWK